MQGVRRGVIGREAQRQFQRRTGAAGVAVAEFQFGDAGPGEAGGPALIEPTRAPRAGQHQTML